MHDIYILIATVTPSASPFYVALPALPASTYRFNATADSKPYIAKATVGTATTAGKYYQGTLKMATPGDLMGQDGKFYTTNDAAKTAGTTAVAMIAYVDSETDHGTYKHGLAIALSDESGYMVWGNAKSACEGRSAVSNAAWLLPSQNQW